MRGFIYILFAAFIDFLQLAIGWGFFILASTAGTTAGAATGCVAGKAVAGQVGCWAGGAILGIIGTFFNAHIAAALVPIGDAMAFAINVSLSATLGVALITLLAMDGMFYPKYIFTGGLAELIPGFDYIPGWTAMTILCVLEKKKQEGGIVGAAAKVATTALSPTGATGSIGNITTAIRAVDGIRAVNDNAPQSYANAA